MSWTTLKSIVTAAALLAAGTALVVQTLRLRTADHAHAALLTRAERAEQHAAAAQEELARAIRAAENDPRTPELARLRAELTSLRRQQLEWAAENTRMRTALTEAGQPVEPAPSDPEEPSEPEREAIKIIGLAKLNYAKQWGLAFHLFAGEHGGRMPTTIEEAAAFFAPDAPNGQPSALSRTVTTQVGEVSSHTVLSTDQYELLYQGRLDQVANPAQTILMRERDPFLVPGRTGLARTYLFADGHAEIHRAPEGDFTAWEQERLATGSP